MNEQRKLPIKVVPPLEKDFIIPESGGGSNKLFAEVEEVQEVLLEQLSSVKEHFATSFSKRPNVPGVMRVSLRREAIAKSHRPTQLFSQESCPIIGLESLGDLLVSVTPSGLDNLIQDMTRLHTLELRANATTIESISSYTPNINDVFERDVVKVKLFNHHNEVFDYEIEQEFMRILQTVTSHTKEKIKYGPGLNIYKVSAPSSELLERLFDFVGIQSISNFPIYYPVRTSALPVGKVNVDDFPLPVEGVTYPTVGVIDTGTQRGIPVLEPWIVSRESYVPRV